MSAGGPLVLAYHSVHPTRRGPLVVRPDAFERQIASLARRGYRSTNLDDKLAAVAARLAGARSAGSGKRVVITFDDGYEDNLIYAQPILERYGFTATVFVVAGLAGTADLLEPELSIARYGGASADYRMLSWDQVQSLAARGWTIGSHTVTHPWLSEVDAGRVRDEVVDSKRILEQRLGGPVHYFCYPAGRFDAEVVEQVRQAGYRGAVVTPRHGGCAETAFTMWRVGVYGHDTAATFRLKVSRAFTIARQAPMLWSATRAISRVRQQWRGSARA